MSEKQTPTWEKIKEIIMMNRHQSIEWKDMHSDVLMRLLHCVDDRTILSSAGVCRGWREIVLRHLTHLSLSWSSNMNDLVLLLIPKFVNMRTLVLKREKSQLEDNAVETIAKHCRHLEDLDLTRNIKLTDLSLHSLSRGCSNLIRLNISLTSFSGSALADMTRFCRNLEMLNLCYCAETVSDNTLKAIGENCNKMQSLNLGHCKNISDNGVMSLAKGCPDLRTLNLTYCVLITDKSVMALATESVHLRSLTLTACENITKNLMYSLVQNLDFNLTHPSLNSLARCFCNLTGLYLAGCTSFSNSDLTNLVKFCRNLQSLSLSSCIEGVSDDTLQAIGENCKKMQSLHLGWCKNISDNGVMNLAKGCPDLRTLSLCGCVLITDESVVAIATRCVHLKSLSLAFCGHITDKSMYSLVQNGVKNNKGKSDEEGLRSLSISYCTKLTPSAVQAICDTFPALHPCFGKRTLHMTGCDELQTSVRCACFFKERKVNEFD